MQLIMLQSPKIRHYVSGLVQPLEKSVVTSLFSCYMAQQQPQEEIKPF